MKLLAFLGVLAAISLQPSVAVAKSGHVYVALEQLTGFGGAPPMILRYPLENNVIGNSPDLTYPSFAGPLAFDAAGNLYAGTGSLQPFFTSAIAAFHPGETTPFAGYGVPGPYQDYYITSCAVDPAGYLSFGYIGYITSSTEPVTGIATYRLSDGTVMNITKLGQQIFQNPIEGMTFDAQAHLYISFNGQIIAFQSVRTRQLKLLGKSYAPIFGGSGPGGLAVSASGFLYAVDLPGARASISSYHLGEFGNVQPARVLMPSKGVNSIVACCSSWGPSVLWYSISVSGGRIYMPFFVAMKSGRSKTGLYQFGAFQNGRSEPTQVVSIVRSPPNEPYVAEAALVGP
jgi:hypothetical protein